MAWKILVTEDLSAEALMQKDAWLLSQLTPESEPILHLYEWTKPSITYGYFTDINLHLKFDALAEHGIDTARRPTGGGIIFHLSDLAFSVLLPASHPAFSINTLANYAAINVLVAQAVEKFTQNSLPVSLATQCDKRECSPFCMAKPTMYDLVIGGKKVGGAAQRRTQNGLLHQGSISLALPPENILSDVLIDGEKIVAEMKQQSFYLTQNTNELKQAKEILRNLLKQVFI